MSSGSPHRQGEGNEPAARMGGGIRGLLAHVAAAVGALKRLSTRGDLHCPPSSSHPRGVCLPLTIPWYSGARGRWVPFPYLEQAGHTIIIVICSSEEDPRLISFLFSSFSFSIFLYLFNFHCLSFLSFYFLSLSSPVCSLTSLFDSVLVSLLSLLYPLIISVLYPLFHYTLLLISLLLSILPLLSFLLPKNFSQ